MTPTRLARPAKRTPHGIRLEPTWTALLPAFFAVLENGTDEGRRIAREELARMAKAADQWNAQFATDDEEEA